MIEKKPIDEVIVSGVSGAISGGLTAAGFGAIGGAVGSFIDSGYGNLKDVRSGEKTVGQAVVGTVFDTSVGAAFGAMGSSTASEIKESMRISKAGWNGAKALLEKGLNPVVKKVAQKSWDTARRYAGRLLIASIKSGIASTGIQKGASWYVDQIYRSYALN